MNAISVVIPVFNEAGNIGNLIRETAACLSDLAQYEIVVVDDASSDGTAAEVQQLVGQVPGLRYIRHAFRAGQSAAIRTGVKSARHPIVATMDGDGQNDPGDIEPLIRPIRALNRSEIRQVGGVRKHRKASLSKRLASRLANGLRSRLLKDNCPDTGCGLKLFRRDVFLDLPYFSGMHRYLPALFQAYGYEASYHVVNDRPRRAGVSKYTNLGRGLIGIYDLIGVRWIIRRTALPHMHRAPGKAPFNSPNASAHEDRQCLKHS